MEKKDELIYIIENEGNGTKENGTLEMGMKGN